MAFELLSIVKHKQPSLSKYPVGGLRVLGVIFLAHPRLKQSGDTPRDCIAWGIGNSGWQSMDSNLIMDPCIRGRTETLIGTGPRESARDGGKFAFVLPDLGPS